MVLSRKTKESIKTALAMTIAYGIALSMDWDRPYWAGFAVTFISLSTVGQSLNKGAMRMLGTLLALTVSLLIIALFAQERWLFMAALSGWLGFCTYRMTVSKRSYFWYLAGFASVVIAFDGGVVPTNAFDTAVLRAEETMLGILVYTLITTLLWPNNSRAGFEDATRALVQAQHRLYSGNREALAGRTPAPGKPDQDKLGQERASTAQQVQALAQFGGTLDAALADSYEVWELRHQWRRFQGQSTALLENLERWCENSKELGELDLNVLLPNVEAATAELERRFAEIERLLAGEALQYQPQPIDLSYDHARLQALSHFHKAALALARTGLQRLDELTRDQFDTVLDIKGLAAAAPGSAPASTVPSAPSDQQGPSLLPGPDNMIAAVRMMVSLWLAYLLWIYVEVPGGDMIMSGLGSIGMIAATTPRWSVLSMLKPVMLTIAFAGILYVFVMPQLSSFVGLGSMIFLTIFALAYLFSTPQQAITRSIAFAFFLMIIDVSNQQQYNFLPVVDTAVMMFMLVGVVALTSYIPFSMQPDKAFLRLLRRFFRSSEYLMSTMRWDRTMTPTRLDYWKRAFHTREVATLPPKLGAWGKVVDTRMLSGTTPEQVQALTTNLQALAHCMQGLLNVRDSPQAPFLVEELLEDFRAWRLEVQASFQRLAEDPAAGERDALRTRLDGFQGQLESRIKEVLNKAAEGQFSNQEAENFYRLLGAYRGVSDAMGEYIKSTDVIHWARWKEERFYV